MQWPWVSRVAFDQALIRAAVAEREAHFTAKEARQCMSEARLAIKEAIEMSKLAQRAMFGSVTDQEVPSSGSVSENDRMAAIRRRQSE